MKYFHNALKLCFSAHSIKKCLLICAACVAVQPGFAQIATTVCYGQTAQLTVPPAILEAATQPVTVNWYTKAFEGNHAGSGTTLTVSNVTETKTYWCEINHAFTRLRSTIYVNSLPDASFSTNSPVCIPSTMTFNAVKVCNDGAFSGDGQESGARSSANNFPFTVQDNLTLMAWVKWKGAAAKNQFIVANGNTASNGYALYVDGATKKLNILLGGVAFLNSNAVLATNVWQHVAMVRAGGVWTLFLNGSAYSVTNKTATPRTPASSGFYVGQNNEGAENFNGAIDEVMAWNEGLEAQTINAYKSGCFNPIPPTLKGYWNFNETSGSQVNDASKNNKTLFLSSNNHRTSSATYAWNFGPGTLAATGAKSSYLYSTAGDRTASLTVTDINGCTGTAPQVVNANNSLPQDVTVTASADNVCQGTAINLKATGGGLFLGEEFNGDIDDWVNDGWRLGANFQFSAPDGSNAYTIQSLGGGQTIQAHLQSPAFSTLNAANANIEISHYVNFVVGGITAKIQLSTDKVTWFDAKTYTSSQGRNNEFATDKIVFPVQFLNKPAVYLKLSYRDISGGDFYAAWAVNKITLYAGPRPPTWTWNSNTGFTSVQQSPTAVVVNASTTFTVVANTGCPSAPGAATVTVKGLPTATVSGTVSVCKNAAAPVITFTGTNGTSPYTFSYKVNSGEPKTVTVPSGNTLTVQQPTDKDGQFAYNLIFVKAANGCVNNRAGAATVTVNPEPIASISLPGTTCLNSDTKLTLSASAGTSPFTFNYKKEGDPFARLIFLDSGVSSYSVAVATSTAGSQVYTFLKVTDKFGCTNAVSKSSTITVHNPPILTLGAISSVPVNATRFYIPCVVTGGASLRYFVNPAPPVAMPRFGMQNGTMEQGPDSLHINIPASAAGSYNFNTRAENIETGCSSAPIPFRLVVGSGNNHLLGLQPGSGSLSPVFQPGITSYTMSVPATTKSLTVKPTVTDSTAGIKVNGLAVKSGSFSGEISLAGGSNIINIVVTAQGSSIKTYTVTVTKQVNIDAAGVSTDAKVAWSLRKLGSIYLHAAITPPQSVPGFTNSLTPLIRVRRSPDNAQLDIGYTATGSLDTVTLKNFAGQGNAFVSIWYDQSGSNLDAVQTVPGSQPYIVNTGVVERKNGMPSLYFFGTYENNVFLTTVPFTAFNNGFSIFVAAGIKADFSGWNAMVTKTKANVPAPWDMHNQIFYMGNAVDANIKTDMPTPFMARTPFSIWGFTGALNTTAQAYINNAANGSINITSQCGDPGTPIMIGTRQDGLTRLDGWISEAVAFASVVSAADRTSITTNQAETYLKPVINAFTPNMAGAGTTVKISGANLSGTTRVAFGGMPAASFSATENTILARVGTGATGDVAVTAQYGTISVPGFTFTIPPGNALSFDGINDHVIIPNPATGDFTIEYWMKTTQRGRNGSLWWQGNGIIDGEVNGVVNDFGTSLLGNKLCFGIGEKGLRDYSIQSTSDVNTGRWVHVAVVRLKTGGMIKLYIDGKLEASSLAGKTDLNAASTLTIGGMNILANYFKGSIDELRIFNTDRSANITADMLNIITPSTPGLQAYYSFDEGTPAGHNSGAKTLSDLSPNGNHGTLHNFGLTLDSSNWVESYAMAVPVASPATSVTGSGFTATWSAPRNGVVTRYLLDVSTDPGFTSFAGMYEAMPVQGTALTITGLNQQTVYYYRLRADKASVTAQGAYSNIITVTTPLNRPVISTFSPAAGVAGDTITINGSDLESATHVSFGGTTATLVVHDSNIIKAVVKHGAIGKVSVTGPGGTATKGGFFFGKPPGNALAFDGINDNVAIQPLLVNNFTAATYETWLYLNKNTNGTILAKQADNVTTNSVFSIGYYASATGTAVEGIPGKIYFRAQNSSPLAASQTILDTERWYHVALVFTATEAKIYINGELDSTTPGDFTVPNLPLATATSIGAWLGHGGGHYFKGRLDELRIWNTALAQQQLQAGMFSTVPPGEPGLAAYFNFDAGIAGGVNIADTVLYDISAGANNGTLNNFSLHDTTSNWVESYAMVVPGVTEPTNMSDSGFTANWRVPVTGIADNYLLDVSLKANFSSFVPGYHAKHVTGTSHAVIGLKQATKYYYRVRANKNSVMGQGGYHHSIVAVTKSTLLLHALLPDTTTLKAAATGEGALKVIVSPNPATTKFSLRVMGGDSRKTVELRVMDISGRTVYHTRGGVFDMYQFGRNFAAGRYIAEVMNGKYIQRIKLVKGN